MILRRLSAMGEVLGHIKEPTKAAALVRLTAEWLPLLEEGDVIIVDRILET